MANALVWRGAFTALLCAGLSFTPRAHAADAGLVVVASPLLGSMAPNDSGWRSVQLHLENTSNQLISGSLTVEMPAGYSSGSGDLTTVLPFAVAAKGHVNLEAPTHGTINGNAQIRVRARDTRGELLTETQVSVTTGADAVVLDLENPSRLATVLRNVPFSSRRGTPLSRTRTAQMAVIAALSDGASGDLTLPDFPSGYSAATLVVGSGRELARLAESEQAALANWVLSGGALALYLDRPEDFGRPLVEALAGGRPERAKVPEGLTRSQLFSVAEDESDPSRSTPTSPKLVRAAPSPETAKRLLGYRGGNLHDTGWGAAATYGLGELHLLAFDPHDATVLADAWSRHKLVALVEHAFGREPHAVVHHASPLEAMVSIDGIRRELDPNQATRWTIVVSALLLLVYAGLAGPLSFYLAARKGRPLRALWQLPLWSGATLAIIMLLGLFGKGTSGRARRLSLFDAGGGMSRAAAVRFRGFYAANSSDLTVRASTREHVLDVWSDLARKLTVDGDGPRLTGLRTKPWQTVLVREDGFAELGGGVSVISVNGDIVVKNRAARDLLGVVVRNANGEATYFARIRDGASVRAGDGAPLGPLGSPLTAGSTAVPLESSRFLTTLDHDYPGLGKAWAALEPAFPSDTEWWPPDVPVVLAALDGGEGKLFDSGFAVDYDRVLLRVVGEGGTP